MKLLRLHLIAFSWFMSLLALFEQIGIDLWGCATCNLVKDLAVSSPLAYGGPVALAVLFFGVMKEWKVASLGVWLAAAAGIGLVLTMIQLETFCNVCFLTHSGLIAAALTTIPVRPLGLGLATLVFASGVGFTGTGGWDKILEQRLRIASFTLRSYEKPIETERVFAIFSDPECVRCKQMEAEIIARLPEGVRVVHRWMLLPHTAYRTMRAANVVEGLSAKSLALGDRYREALYASVVPLTDPNLLAIGREIGCESDVAALLKAPGPGSLTALVDDHHAATELKIEELPSIAEVGPPDDHGLRKMRWVPTSDLVRLLKPLQ